MFDNYPAGVSPFDEHFYPEVVHSCYACGGDIISGEIYYKIDTECYCRECCTEHHPTEGDCCQICGETEERLFNVDGELICENHITLETAGEEW